MPDVISCVSRLGGHTGQWPKGSAPDLGHALHLKSNLLVVPGQTEVGVLWRWLSLALLQC